MRAKAGLILLQKDHGGKPFAEGTDWELSISHSANAVSVALANKVRVGIDIEELRVFPHMTRLGNRVLQDSRLEWGVDEFYAAWTRREAIGKALGVGLRLGEQVDVDERIWSVEQVHICDGFSCTLAVEARPIEIEVRRLELEPLPSVN